MPRMSDHNSRTNKRSPAQNSYRFLQLLYLLAIVGKRWGGAIRVGAALMLTALPINYVRSALLFCSAVAHIRLRRLVAPDAQWVPQPQQEKKAGNCGDDGTLIDPISSIPFLACLILNDICYHSWWRVHAFKNIYMNVLYRMLECLLHIFCSKLIKSEVLVLRMWIHSRMEPCSEH